MSMAMPTRIIERVAKAFAKALATKDAEIKRLRDDVAEAFAALNGAQVLAECYFADHGRDPANNDNYCRICDWLKAHTALAGKDGGK